MNNILSVLLPGQPTLLKKKKKNPKPSDFTA